MIFQLIIVQIITFIGLVLVLRKILISSSYAETKRLQTLTEENTKKQRELAGKISDVENDYRDRMSKADEEIRNMRARAKKETEELREAIVAKGKAEGERLIAQALNAKDEIRSEIEEQMQDKSVEYALKIFQDVLSSDEQKFIFDGLLDSFIKELSEISKDQLQSADLSQMSSGTVKVQASHSMSSEQKKKLEEVLSSKFSQDLTVQEVLDKDIIAGIVIALGSFILDGSLSERFRRAVEALK